MGGTQGGVFFLDQDQPNQGRKVKRWRPRQKESAQESHTGSWRAASGELVMRRSMLALSEVEGGVRAINKPHLAWHAPAQRSAAEGHLARFARGYPG